jgi:hypothetical protein
MKISSIGVNAYREMTDQTRVIQKTSVPKQPEHIEKTGQVHIPGQANNIGSKLSVRLPSADYAEMLSPEERQALELLFQHYGKGIGKAAASANSEAGLGNFVDVKL